MVAQIFKTTGPLDFDQDRAVFVERPELKEIFREIRRPYVESYVALLGSRQTGKTTLLYRVYRDLKQAGEPTAFVDLSASRLENISQSYAHAALKIWEELTDELASPGKLRAVAGAVDGPIRFREFALELARQCGGMRIIILLDEVGSFMSNMGFFETLRNISSSSGHDSEQAFKKYLFVFSGSVDLHDLTSGQNSPLANVCKLIHLQDFDLSGTRFLVDNLRQIAPVEDSVAEYVHDLARGHPYLTQRICALLAQVHPPGHYSIQDVDRAIDQMHEGDENLRYVTMQLERHPQARDLLRRMMMEGLKVPFSTIDPRMARLLVIGAVRREKVIEAVDGVPRERSLCAIRNPIYEASLRQYFDLVSASQRDERPYGSAASRTGDALSKEDSGESRASSAADPRSYLDFHLRIHPRSAPGQPFTVTVESWAGTGRGKLALDVQDATLWARIERLKHNQANAQDLPELGTKLWRAVFSSPQLERRYLACQAEASTQKGIRFKLEIEHPNLAALPWEYMYDPESQTFPALSPRTPITRYTNPHQQEPPPLKFDPPLRILLVSAVPVDQAPLDVESERKQITEAMKGLQRAGKVEIESLEHATMHGLQAMLRRPFHVLHYIGHGAYDERTGNGMLVLEDAEGYEHAVSAAQLHYLLRDTTIRLAVFNACMTTRGAAGRSIAGELMRAGLCATLAMQYAISEASATIFAGEFYRTLADGWPVDAAATEGRKAVMFATDLHVMDWGIPVLFMRTRDGVLFRRQS